MSASILEARISQMKPALEVFIAERAKASHVTLAELSPLSGGAIQENWSLALEIEGGPQAGLQELVLRSDAPSRVAASLDRAEEFAVLEAVWQAGVKVPEPLWICTDTTLIGRSFYLMRKLRGIASGPQVVKDDALGADRSALARELGRQLARIHTIRPPRGDLKFLGPPPSDPARAAIQKYRGFLDELEAHEPSLEWGLRWCERNSPPPGDVVLVHQDFRTGNYLTDAEGLVAVLDWEFADWGDPMSDIGWFCAGCWRFSRPDLEAGGIAERVDFYDGYREASGREIDEAAVAFWEIMAHIRWAVIALQQGARFLSGGEASLELALIGRIYPPDLALSVLHACPPDRMGKWSDDGSP